MHPRARHRVDAQYRFSERVTKGTQVILKVTKDGKGSIEFEKPSSCDSQSLAVLHVGQILRKGLLNWPEPAWLGVGGERDVVGIQHSE